MKGGIDSLSLRQLAILEGWAQGLTDPEIADQLGISRWTVKTHGGRILDRLGVKKRAQAVAVWKTP